MIVLRPDPGIQAALAPLLTHTPLPQSQSLTRKRRREDVPSVEVLDYDMYSVHASITPAAAFAPAKSGSNSPGRVTAGDCGWEGGGA